MAKKTTNREGNLYDKILKENAEQLFLPLVEKKLGIKIKSFHPLQEKFQTTVEREMDFFYEITTADDKELLLHLEFQTENDSEMLYRTAEYHGMALRRKKLPIRHVLIYLGAKEMTMKTELPAAEIFHSFEVINIHKMNTSDLLASQVPEIILLAVLSDIPTDKVEAILRIIVQQLRLVSKNPNELSKYLQQLIILSRLRKFENTTTKIVKNMPLTYDITTDYLYLQGIEQGIEQGKNRWEEQGQLKKAILASINMLKKQFDTTLIAEVLGIDLKLVTQIQGELKQEKKIISLLTNKQTAKKIATDLKVSEIFVEVMQEYLTKKTNKK